MLKEAISFPPKNAPIKSSKGEKSAVVGMFPTSRLASSKLWDPKLRHKLSNPKFKKKDIDARKEEVRCNRASFDQANFAPRILFLVKG